MFGIGIGLWGVTPATSGGAGGGTWTPLTPANGKLFWVDPSDLTTLFQDTGGTVAVTADGQSVKGIKDKFSGTVLFTNGTTASAPVYQSNSGKPYLDFSGGKEIFTTTGTTLTNTDGQHSYMAAVKFNTNSTLMLVANGDHATRVGQFLRMNSGNLETIAFDTLGNAYTDVGSALAANTAYVLREQTTTTTTEAFVNGATNGSTAVSNTLQSGTGQLFIGDSANVFDGKLFGLIAYKTPLSSGDASSADSYLTAKM